MQSDYEYFMKTDISLYLGEWIAIHNKKIVANGQSFKKMFEQAKKANPGPFVARVPDKDTDKVIIKYPNTQQIRMAKEKELESAKKLARKIIQEDIKLFKELANH